MAIDTDVDPNYHSTKTAMKSLTLLASYTGRILLCSLPNSTPLSQNFRSTLSHTVHILRYQSWRS